MAHDPRCVMKHDSSKDVFIDYLNRKIESEYDITDLVDKMIDCIHDMDNHIEMYRETLYRYNKQKIDLEMNGNPVSKLLYEEEAVDFMSRLKDEYSDLETKDIVYVVFHGINNCIKRSFKRPTLKNLSETFMMKKTDSIENNVDELDCNSDEDECEFHPGMIWAGDDK